jgi:hypothetical protein
VSWPAGAEWRVSPSGTLLRWWDGSGWSEHVAGIPLEGPWPGPPVRYVPPPVVLTAPIRIVPTDQLPVQR